METMLAVSFFLFGLIFGSFFNVVGLRSPIGRSFVSDRSYCPACKSCLRWYELLPILSFTIQAGKCRHCQIKISRIYPATEFLTGILFSFSFLRIGLEIELVVALFFISLLMIIFVSDIRYMLIENKILLFFTPIFIFLRFIQPLDPWWSLATGAAAGFGIVFLVILLSRGGMGAGDMKLFGVLGVVLGPELILLTFFLSCLIGSVFGMLLLSLGMFRRKQPVPFGPYIIFASLISYFYGHDIVNWYFSFTIMN